MNRHLASCLAVAAGLALAQPGLPAPPLGHGGGFGMTGGTGSFHGAGADPLDPAGRNPQPTTVRPSAAEAAPETLLSKNSALKARLQALLPAGTTPQQACAGFEYLGNCVAAVHVASNLGIPFSDLKSRLTGTGAVSLGSAIHELRPDANARSAQRRAEHETQSDLRGTAH